ncbi:DUF420 domain-containing protein [Polycladomyces sp. WAk]|uniref:DUF420 domain-containing protein n=1 Tax=Polycladomyces zharkentensis TaxID=2807616 RepID=A0ABS2WLS9_9BACL|nr:DUF420 domain-containing protein [Polycladomyces sp. WAk]MBN2910479.1 DUF420 domain-containing protein [Polycladomyces sp. WAk]
MQVSISMLLATVSTSCTVTSAICMAAGWVAIKKKKVDVHKRLMWLSVFFAFLFFVLYMSRTVLIGNTAFGGPESLKTAYNVFLAVHILLTVLSPVLVITTMTFAYRKRFDRHKRLGRRAAVIWFVTAITGVMVYLLLFVIFPPGPTTNHFQ